MKRDSVIHSVDRWVADLLAAGWTRGRHNTVWVRPDGAMFLGPYGAWCQLQREMGDALQGKGRGTR